MPSWEYLVGDVREVLAGLPEHSIQTIVTSPPYWGLRDYGISPSIWGGLEECEHEWGEHIREHGDPVMKGKTRWQHTDGGSPKTHPEIYAAGVEKGDRVVKTDICIKCGAWRGCLGLEPTPEMFIEHMVEVCRGLWRVLRDDGTFWLNLGDCYAGGATHHTGRHDHGNKESSSSNLVGNSKGAVAPGERTIIEIKHGLKPKDLVMMPHRVALALQADGWYVRSTIVWSKPNPMPESCTDRPTSSHEYIFLLTKRARYYYDADAVREPQTGGTHARGKAPDGSRTLEELTPKSSEVRGDAGIGDWLQQTAVEVPMGRNLRNVWQIATQPYPEAHFATFPMRIPELCIKAGTSEKGCCPKCGAPWERVLEQINPNARTSGRGKEQTEFQKGEGRLSLQRPTSLTQEQVGVYRTTGFQPTCECVEEWKRRCGADSKGEYHGKATKDYAAAGAEDPSAVKARILAGMVPKVTTGFQPTCDCPVELEPIPCTVLDPFAGSGTTIAVARRLGRSAVGIDISSEYRKLADNRAMLHTKSILSYGEETA